MSKLSVGLVGLPNVGKSTLFNAITKAGAEAANYPFCTIEPNVGIVTVPDRRVDRLTQIVEPKKVQYATIEFVDIAGLVKGASKGEGKGNQFLDNIHHTDAILHVVRCFENENITHVDNKIDPLQDSSTINLELILADLQTVESSLVRLEKKARGNDALAVKQVAVMKKIQEHLSEELPLRSLDLTDDEEELIKTYRFITSKPMIYAANVGEEDLPSMQNSYVEQLSLKAEKEQATLLTICAKIEEEISQLEKDDVEDFLQALELTESGLDRMIKVCFNKLGLATYLTAGVQEVRAWTIRQGMTAPQAASVIHTDFEKGFIRAEVSKFSDVDELGSIQAVKEKGLMKVEGKDYIVQDGDVVYFRVSTK